MDFAVTQISLLEILRSTVPKTNELRWKQLFERRKTHSWTFSIAISLSVELLKSICQLTFTVDPKWQAFLWADGPLEKDHWFPGPRYLFISRPLILNTEAPAEKVVEVNGKSNNAFDSSSQKASNIQFCIFSLYNASNHNLYYPDQLYSSDFTALFSFNRSSWHFEGGDIIMVWDHHNNVRPWKHTSIKSESLTVAVEETTQTSYLIGARIQSRQSNAPSPPFVYSIPRHSFSYFGPMGPNFWAMVLIIMLFIFIIIVTRSSSQWDVVLSALKVTSCRILTYPVNMWMYVVV